MIWAPKLAGLALAYLCSDPYCRTRVDTGIANDPNAHCLYWENTQVQFVQNQEGNPATPDLGFPAISRAWQNWEAVAAGCGSSLQISEGAHSASRYVGYVLDGGNENLALFRQKECTGMVSQSDPCWDAGTCLNVYDCWQWSTGTIALTTTTYDANTGIIFDADIELNAAKYIFTDVNSPPCFPTAQNQLCVATDIQNTVTHETGHAIGLDHNTSSTSTMYNSAPIGETSKRNIDPGSQSFVCEVYWDGGAPKDCVIFPVSSDLGAQPGCSQAGGWPVAMLLVALGWFLVRRPARSRGGAR